MRHAMFEGFQCDVKRRIKTKKTLTKTYALHFLPLRPALAAFAAAATIAAAATALAFGAAVVWGAVYDAE